MIYSDSHLHFTAPNRGQHGSTQTSIIPYYRHKCICLENRCDQYAFIITPMNTQDHLMEINQQ